MRCPKFPRSFSALYIVDTPTLTDVAPSSSQPPKAKPTHLYYSLFELPLVACAIIQLLCCQYVITNGFCSGCFQRSCAPSW